VLEASGDEERLRLSGYERWPPEERPVKVYEYIEVSFGTVQHEVETLVTLRQANRSGTLEAPSSPPLSARSLGPAPPPTS
jgi:hypothetical protein